MQEQKFLSKRTIAFVTFVGRVFGEAGFLPLDADVFKHSRPCVETQRRTILERTLELVPFEGKDNLK